MNKKDLKRILRELRELTDELEVAVLADKDSYTSNVDYDEVVSYYQYQDSAEEGL